MCVLGCGDDIIIPDRVVTGLDGISWKEDGNEHCKI
jgi:hypothetical protein